MDRDKVVISLIFLLAFAWLSWMAIFPRSFTIGLNWYLRQIHYKSQLLPEDQEQRWRRAISGLGATFMLYLIVRVVSSGLSPSQ